MRNLRIKVGTFLFAACSLLPVRAQRVEHVHGTATYILSINEEITLAEARHRVLAEAKAEAIKAVFGELVTSDVFSQISNTNGQTKQQFEENTELKARGIWLGDTQKPVVAVKSQGDYIVFSAEVWGDARELKQAPIEFVCQVWSRNSSTQEMRKSTDFGSGEQIIVDFQAPANGFFAIYLLDEDDTANCLLPYRFQNEGAYIIEANKSYRFFDRTFSSKAVPYRLTTKRETERNQLVLVFSPNRFVKCNEITGDVKHPNSLSTSDFQKWLLRAMRNDTDMQLKKYDLFIRSK